MPPGAFYSNDLPVLRTDRQKGGKNFYHLKYSPPVSRVPAPQLLSGLTGRFTLWLMVFDLFPEILKNIEQPQIVKGKKVCYIMSPG